MSPSGGIFRSLSILMSAKQKLTDNLLEKKKNVEDIPFHVYYLFQSLFFEIPGPTLPYLKDRIQVNYEEVSRVLVARSVGYFPGTIMAGFM